MSKKYELYNGDCLEIIDELIAKGVKVDLTVTSPPYDTLRSYKGTLEWNFEIFKNLAKKLYDITADGGVVVWVVADETKKWTESGSSFNQALYFKEIGFNLHDTMIWEKTNPMPQMNWSRYTNAFEYMFVFSKGKPKTCNYLMEECKCKGQKNGKNGFKNKGEGERITKDTVIHDYKIKNNVWRYGVSQFKGHPATFPEQLAEDHILSWSNEGDVVMDCFMGGNTTGKMALKNNRKYIGVEKVKDYYELSIERLSE